uniref:Uncharacterized protein n=1 Tax=Ananas comosus var. bracteatus TaxID=296719 RepID=A0A6V7NIU6_ANACO|nr:unnamed protein product [Ananas comosus var. bracteatus]
MLVLTTSKVWWDQPRILLKISWKGIENPERGKFYYHYDSTTIAMTIDKDVSCFVANLDGSMTEIFRELDAAVPFLSRLPPDSFDKLDIERHLRDGVRKAVRSCGSGGFVLRFEITVVFGSDSDDQYPYTIVVERPELATADTDADPIYSPTIDRKPPTPTTVMSTEAVSSSCPICMAKLFGEESKAEWLPCAHDLELSESKD